MEISYETPKQSARFATHQVWCDNCGEVVLVTGAQWNRLITQPNAHKAHCQPCGPLVQRIHKLNNNIRTGEHFPKSVVQWERELGELTAKLEANRN